MKILAFYLPQYHEIPENNKWWGAGFTDWVNVKKAKPLFENHNQPRVPVDGNYYDILNSRELKHQGELAKKYGIDGFCFYHYYFSGKKLLEKPLENMLADRTVDIPFCLAWANEPWTRAWDGKDKDVLMQQEYGNIENWTVHFNYLSQFFLDERYIKIDGSPVILIYRTENIERINDMVACWKQLAIECGFSGLHVVEMLTSFQNNSYCNNSDAIVEFEPTYTMKYHLPIYHRAFSKIVNKIFWRSLNMRSYDAVWRSIISRKRNNLTGKPIYLGAFVDWDNTPRKGLRGAVMRNFSVTKFKYFFSKQLAASKEKNNSLMFINAWNEWAEGAYLEPDRKNGYGILEAVHASVTESRARE